MSFTKTERNLSTTKWTKGQTQEKEKTNLIKATEEGKILQVVLYHNQLLSKRFTNKNNFTERSVRRNEQE